MVVVIIKLDGVDLRIYLEFSSLISPFFFASKITSMGLRSPIDNQVAYLEEL